eukprot:3417664-Karenia_brevis.AAC.1
MSGCVRTTSSTKESSFPWYRALALSRHAARGPPTWIWSGARGGPLLAQGHVRFVRGDLWGQIHLGRCGWAVRHGF